MADSVADALFNHLIDAFTANRAYAASDIARDPMPGPLRMYFEQRMAQHLDGAASQASAWLDADHPDVRQAASAYRSVLARHIRIPAAEWRSELALACRTVASYLIRPVPTLTDVVFDGGKQEASADEVTERLDALPAYPYFSEVISAYLERKNLERISRERFSGLARRIDHQMVRDFGADEWMDLLEPLLHITRQLPEFSGAVPADALRTFLKEKGADALVSRLDVQFGNHHESLIKPQELRELFEYPAEEEVPEAAGYENVSAAERIDRTDSSGRGSHVPLWKQFESGLHHDSDRATPAAPPRRRESAPGGGRAPAAQPLWKQFHGGPVEGGSAPHQGPSPNEKAAPRKDVAPWDQPAPRKEPASREKAAPHQGSAPQERAAPHKEPAPRENPGPSGGAEPHRHAAPRPDLLGGSTYSRHDSAPGHRDSGRRFEDEPSRERAATASISGRTTDASAHARDLERLERSVLGDKGMRNRNLFLRHLFSGSERAYEDTLRVLYAAESWSEASQIIAREVFLKHQVNIYSEPAVTFTDAAEARFRR